ncbi:hypothetical protein MRB53_021886 [Persea americana]|uniref:Uncharacterized protein n=1 Tax=Persea americana TaxID=3435 RepID=A0ACC2L5C8_PERAE|nr:hypothetical protein MRB53_021886 [Persea americana]
MRWNLSSLLSQLVDYQRHSDLDNNGDLKISDFGLGSVVNQVHNNGLSHTIYGTLAYVAPKKEGVSPLPLLFASPPSSSSSPKPTTPPPLSSLLTLPVLLPPIPLQAHSSSAFCLLSLHHLDLPTPTLTSLSDPILFHLPSIPDSDDVQPLGSSPFFDVLAHSSDQSEAAICQLFFNICKKGPLLFFFLIPKKS